MVHISFEKRLIVVRVLNRYIMQSSSAFCDRALLLALGKWIGQSKTPRSGTGSQCGTDYWISTVGASSTE